MSVQTEVSPRPQVGIGLIQLVSEEPMPCLLPILAFKPAEVMHVVTHRYEKVSRHVMRAADAVGAAPAPDHYYLKVLEDMPAMAEITSVIQEGIARFRDQGLTPIINFTGGTKLMSIGAFRAATQGEIVSFYVDGQNRVFLDGATGAPLENYLSSGVSLEPLSATLSVPIILEAHGCLLKSASRNIDHLIPLADYLLRNPTEEERAFESMAGRDGAFSKIKNPHYPKNWINADAIRFELPAKLAEVAVEVGIVAGDGDKFKLCVPDSKVTSPEKGMLLQANYQFFEGVWWEVAVANAVQNSGAFANVHLNVSISKGGPNPMEEDILALQGLQLAYFSCKRRNAVKLKRHLEELDASARRLGGRLARKYLAVCHLPELMRNDLLERAAQLEVRLIEPFDLQDKTTFLKAISP
jgi:hypothetical protein